MSKNVIINFREVNDLIISPSDDGYVYIWDLFK